MMRELAPLAAIGLVLIPDGATAFFGHRLARPLCPPPTPVLVCPPIVLAPPCLPMYQIVPLPPILGNVVPLATPTPAAPSPDKPTQEAPKSPRVSIAPADPVTPATGVNPPMVPRLDPTPSAPEPATRPVSPEFVVPELKSPTPRSTTPSSPDFVVPELKSPTPRPTPGASPNIPATQVPGGRLSESNTPDRTTTEKPTAPKLKPVTNSDGLTPLALPSVGRIAKSSPLRSQPAYDLYPLDGSVDDGSTTRKVDFINLSGQSVTLTVEGETATLPDRSALQVRLETKFEWQVNDGSKITTRVPAGAPGVDVILRR